MRIDNNGMIKWGNGEPSMRSCWICNSSHSYLKKANYPIYCFLCGRILIYGKVLQESNNDKEAKHWIDHMYKQENECPVTVVKINKEKK